VRIARICDPATQELYPNFCHNTRTYVGIEHDAPSVLFVYNDQEPSWASIQVDGREVHRVQLTGTQAVIELHKLMAPPPAPADLTEALSDVLGNFLRLKRRKPNCRSHQRLYKFSLVLQADTDQRETLATYDFHVLCPREFEEANAYHRQICADPAAIAPHTIAERAEGRCCPNCRRTREERAD
jgi:hypothetical protein